MPVPASRTFRPTDALIRKVTPEQVKMASGPIWILQIYGRHRAGNKTVRLELDVSRLCPLNDSRLSLESLGTQVPDTEF